MAHQYKNLEDTVYLGGSSNNTSGSGDDGATPSFSVRLAGAAAGAAPVFSGTPTLLTGAAYPAGAYEIAVAATAANGFVVDGEYLVFFTLTVDAQTPTEFVGSFQLAPVLADVTRINGSAPAATNFGNMYNGTGYLDDTAPSSRSQVGSLSAGAGGIATIADGQVVTLAGVETNDYTVTDELNGIYHIIPPNVSDELEFYYEFTLGDNGVLTSIEWDGYVQSKGDNAEVFLYNWIKLQWDQVGFIEGKNGTTPQNGHLLAISAHTGTGANLGKVRAQITSSGADVVQAVATDRIIASFAVVNNALGYMGGAVWIDTIDGEAGTADGIGTLDRPVNNIADARAIAESHNLKRFNSNPGSLNVLAQEYQNYFFEGTGSSLDMGGQDISDARFTDMIVSGTGTGVGVVAFRTVLMNNVTLNNAAVMLGCPFAGTFTMGAGPNYRILAGSVASETAGVVFDFTATVTPNLNLHMTNWSGDLEIQNMGQGGTDKTFISGSGELTINANCIGGTVEYYGEIVIIDNSGGAVTLIGGNIQAILSDIGALNDLSVADILTTPMSESYAADGAAPSLAQAILLVQQKVGDFKVAGTTLTVNKLDGIAAAATYTLDDAANPTSTTRST